MSSEPVSIDYVGQVAPDAAAIVDDDRPRAALAVLAEAPQPLSEAALARAVAVRIADEAPAEIDDETVRSVGIALHHHHLPKLADCGLVDWDAGDRTATATDRGREVASELRTDDALDALAASGGGKRVPVLVTLATLEGPVELGTLADAVVDDHDAWNDPDEAVIRLHHVALPRLEDAGLLVYDVDERLIEFR